MYVENDVLAQVPECAHKDLGETRRACRQATREAFSGYKAGSGRGVCVCLSWILAIGDKPCKQVPAITYENLPHARSVAHHISLLPPTMTTPNAIHS